MRWLSKIVGSPLPNWQLLESFLPDSLSSKQQRKSALAVTFSATLELVRLGGLRLQQGEPFGPIYVKGPAKIPANGQ